MSKIFGTDGARGLANSEITCELAINIARSLILVLKKNDNNKLKIFIGKDPRISSDMLESAIISGICSMGADAYSLGIVPTPAVAYLVKKYKADAGIMISASHNSYEFNGIKIFNNNGYKLSENLEQKIENFIFKNNFNDFLNQNIGKIFYKYNYLKEYINYIKNSVKNKFDNIKIAIDCSNGSACESAKILFEELNANFNILFDKPDGVNINKNCGSTDLNYLSEYVKKNKMDLGIAFDGDADRCLAVDENGEIIDGDVIMAICAQNLKEKNKLNKNILIGTVMSNIGLLKFCEDQKIKFIQSQVGDKYVLEKMLEHNSNLGGEQSGHVIFSEYSTTGDGQLTAVQLIDILISKNQKLSQISKLINKYPQFILNLKINNIKNINIDNITKKIMSEEELNIKNNGRIIIRKSGTEPVIRILVEHVNLKQAENIANNIKLKILKNINNIKDV